MIGISRFVMGVSQKLSPKEVSDTRWSEGIKLGRTIE